METKKTFYFLVLFTFLFSLNSYGQKMPLIKKVNKSDLIVIGDVQDIEGGWGERLHIIFTYVTVSIEECIKGSNSLGNIRVIFPGGIIKEEGIGMGTSAATPSFRKKEKVLLFLKTVPDEKNYALVDSVYGKYPINSRNKVGNTNRSVKKLVNKIKTIMALEEKK